MLIFGSITDEIKALEAKYAEKLVVADWLNRRLVSNQGNKKVGFLNWFGLKEGFSYDLVMKLMQRSGIQRDDVFLDPFSGAGTSLFAASNKGLKPIGIELLPIGKFLHETRMAAFQVDLNDLSKEVKRILSSDWKKLEPSNEFRFRHLTITQGAFPQDTENEMANYLGYVAAIKNKEVRQLLMFACFSVLERISYTSKDGQYLRWDKRGGRVRAGNYLKPKVSRFHEAISQTLSMMLSTVEGRKLLSVNEDQAEKDILLISGSALEKLPELDSNSVDLIISSPPYCNRYDYTRTYALELAFLGVDNRNLKELRQRMLSCTVENKSKEGWLRGMYEARGRLDAFERARSTFLENKSLTSILEGLKVKMENGELNNKGIYRMVYNYFYEHSFIIQEMARIMKQSGKIYYINDNVQYAGVPVPVDLILSEFAETSGLTVNKIYYLKRGKGNSSQQMGLHGRGEQRKCVYEWERV